MNRSPSPKLSWLETELSKLRPDAEIARRYCERHASEAAGVSFDHGPHVRVVVYVTDSLPRHQSALRTLVAHPEQLVTAQAVRSRAEQERVVEQLREMAPAATHEPKIIGYGPRPDGVVTIRVLHGEDAVAVKLKERYGEAARVTFGHVSQAF